MTDPGEKPEIAPAQSAGASRSSLYRVFWRWHFYAGILVTPVLLVVAITGGLYVFKDELEGILYRSSLYVEPGSARVPIEEQIAATKANLPEGYRIASVSVWADPTRSTEVFCLAKGQPFRQVYVDPYSGAIRGELSGDGLFRTVLKLHRTLFLGTTGRVVVELTTGWAILLLVTGLYLWWPRKGSVAGVLYPRLLAKPYVVLRDLHTVAGFYLLPVAILIALTGLLYTLVWGSGFHLAAEKAGAFERTPLKSVSPPDAKPLTFDAAFDIARARYPNAKVLTLSVPAKPDAALEFFAAGTTGPSLQGTFALDHSTGEVLSDVPAERQPALRQWSNWNYPLHVGSVLGTSTKVIWLSACLVLVALPVTGVWMWWKRRPKGQTGFPRRPEVRVSRWLVGLIALLGVLLPVVGVSMIVILLGEWGMRLFRSRRVRTLKPKSPSVS